MGETKAERVILIVEDDADLRETMQDVIETEGFSVLTAANGKLALEALQGRAKPCLILLDLMMPVMSGWDFLKWLNDQPPPLSATPVLIVSAAGLDKIEAAQRSYKAATVIQKPIQLPALLAAIARLC